MANIFDNSDKIWNRSLDDIMSESFGKYAKYIIQDRALPDIRDGLKPVQRRILFAMNDLNITFDKPYKKSARTVGEVIGKYHPHGDSSIYEAMVRMSQEWKNNIPLLDMQGNKGSIDGDSPAAMRYTECRLSKYGQILLDEIKKDTVKFIFNFDDSEKEPSVLPSLIPNILLNGSTGIAAGYATNIPPFNINEVLDAIIFRIENDNCTIEDIASIMKGPDFPTGGIIQGVDGILDIYKTGKGKFNIRGKCQEISRNTNKKSKQLIITELPYEVNKASLVKSIDEIRVNNRLPGLKEVRDDSDKNGISIFIDLDTDKSLEVIKNFLYKNTQLQISYSANIVLIKDRKPVQINILEIINSYLEHANDIIIKFSQFDLNKALARKEILEGLIVAISNIDLLVDLIKSSNSKDEAKEKLMQNFKLNERQAEAVVQLRLYILTSYDTQKLKDEYAELLELIKEKEQLISQKKIRNQWLINKLNYFKETFGHERRTKIENEIDEIIIEEIDVVEEKKGIAIITRDNYIKFINNLTIQDIDLEKIKIKENDVPVEILNLSTIETLLCFTNKGKCISIPAHKIKMTKSKDNGIHINEIITIDSADKTIAAFAISKNSSINNQLIISTKKSLVKKMTIEDFIISKNPKIFSYINLKNEDEVVSLFVLKENFDQLITITKNGYSLRYKISDIPLVGRTASGVKNISLKPEDYVVSTFALNPEETFVLIASNRGAKRIYFDDIVLSSRTKSGKIILSQTGSNPYVIHSAFMISGRQSLNILEDTGKLFNIKASEIPISEVNSRMSKYPNNIISSVVFSSIVDINRNLAFNDVDNNFANLNIKNKKENLEKNIRDKSQSLTQENDFNNLNTNKQTDNEIKNSSNIDSENNEDNSLFDENELENSGLFEDSEIEDNSIILNKEELEKNEEDYNQEENNNEDTLDKEYEDEDNQEENNNEDSLDKEYEDEDNQEENNNEDSLDKEYEDEDNQEENNNEDSLDKEYVDKDNHEELENNQEEDNLEELENIEEDYNQENPEENDLFEENNDNEDLLEKDYLEQEDNNDLIDINIPSNDNYEENNDDINDILNIIKDIDEE